MRITRINFDGHDGKSSPGHGSVTLYGRSGNAKNVLVAEDVLVAILTIHGQPESVVFRANPAEEADVRSLFVQVSRTLERRSASTEELDIFCRIFKPKE